MSGLTQFLVHPSYQQYMTNLSEAMEAKDSPTVNALLQQRLSYFTSQSDLPTPDPAVLGPPALYPMGWIPHGGNVSWPKLPKKLTAPATLAVFTSEPVTSSLGTMEAKQLGYHVFTQPGSYTFRSGKTMHVLEVEPSVNAIPMPSYFSASTPMVHYPEWGQWLSANPGDQVIVPMNGRSTLGSLDYDNTGGLVQGKAPGQYYLAHPGNYLLTDPKAPEYNIMLHVQGPRRQTIIPWSGDGQTRSLRVTVPQTLRFLGSKGTRKGIHAYVDGGRVRTTVVKEREGAFDTPYWLEVPGQYSFRCPMTGSELNVTAEDPVMNLMDGMTIYTNQPVKLQEEWMLPGNPGRYWKNEVSWSTPGNYTLVPRNRYGKANLTVLPRPSHCYTAGHLLSQLRFVAPVDFSPAYVQFWADSLRRHERRRRLMKRVTLRLLESAPPVSEVPFQANLTDDEWNQLQGYYDSGSKRDLLRLAPVASAYLDRIGGYLPSSVQNAYAANPNLANTLWQYTSENGMVQHQAWLAGK